MEMTETIGDRNITEASAAERDSSQLTEKLVERRLHRRATRTNVKMIQGKMGSDIAPCAYECEALLAESQGRARLELTMAAPIAAKTRRCIIASFATPMF
jgi:hypothetical protein